MATLIASLPLRLPEDVRTNLAANIGSVAAAAPGFSLTADMGGIHVVLAIAIGATHGNEADIALWNLQLIKGTRVRFAALPRNAPGLSSCPVRAVASTDR